MFNFKRFALLVKKDTLQDDKNHLIRIAALVTVSLVIFMISTATGGINEAYEGLFLPLLWLGGFIFTSASFRDAHSTESIHTWLMTPASQLEKFILKLMMTTVVYVLVLIVGVFLGSLLNSLVYALFFSARPPLFNPFQGWVGYNILHYVIIQSLFFLGAVWFRKHNFLKTILALNVIQISLALIIGGIGALSFLGPLREAQQGNAFFFMEAGKILMNFFASISPRLFTVLKIVYFALFAPFFWFMSWLRMKEIEVKDGV